jgi:hypothetical protein
VYETSANVWDWPPQSGRAAVTVAVPDGPWNECRKVAAEAEMHGAAPAAAAGAAVSESATPARTSSTNRRTGSPLTIDEPGGIVPTASR